MCNDCAKQTSWWKHVQYSDHMVVRRTGSWSEALRTSLITANDSWWQPFIISAIDWDTYIELRHTLWHQKVIFFLHWLFYWDWQWIGLKHEKWTGVVSPCELCSFLENPISGVTVSNFSHDKTKRFSIISLDFWCRRKGIQCMIFTTM